MDPEPVDDGGARRWRGVKAGFEALDFITASTSVWSIRLNVNGARYPR